MSLLDNCHAMLHINKHWVSKSGFYFHFIVQNGTALFTGARSY